MVTPEGGHAPLKEAKSNRLTFRAEIKVTIYWMRPTLKHTPLWYLPKCYPALGMIQRRCPLC